jgi:hypothetical protein
MRFPLVHEFSTADLLTTLNIQEQAFEKSRLVEQAYKDADEKGVLTQSPTIQRASQCLLLSLAASIEGMEIYLHNISQAYTQSETTLARDFFVQNSSYQMIYS